MSGAYLLLRISGDEYLMTSQVVQRARPLSSRMWLLGCADSLKKPLDSLQTPGMASNHTEILKTALFIFLFSLKGSYPHHAFCSKKLQKMSVAGVAVTILALPTSCYAFAGTNKLSKKTFSKNSLHLISFSAKMAYLLFKLCQFLVVT